MNLRKFAARGLIGLAVFAALCMFFSGTIKTITTAKIKLTQGYTGRLEETISLEGRIAYPQVDHIGFPLDQGLSLTITKVNTRSGYRVSEGDVIIEAKVAGYDTALQSYQDSYEDALDQLLELETKNSGIRVRQSDEEYAEAYFTLRDAMKDAMAAQVSMESLLAQECLTLPESGYPDGASDALVKAIDAWRAAEQDQSDAQTALDSASRLKPDDTTWAYICDRRSCQEKMDEAQANIQSLQSINASAQSIAAPHDGYIAEVNVKEGDTYDGTGDLFTMPQAVTLTVHYADLPDVTGSVSEGTAVTATTSRSGTMETEVTGIGIDDEGKRFAEISLNDELISAMGGVYAMTLANTPLQIVNRASVSTTLISAGAVHGSGADRYVYTVETSYSSFGSSKMTVSKTSVTVLGEADGWVSIEEDLAYTDIAYMEDRPLNDGDTVMEYTD